MSIAMNERKGYLLKRFNGKFPHIEGIDFKCYNSLSPYMQKNQRNL